MSAIDALAPRILSLPADVRAALARVDGPGWYFSRRDGATTLHDCAPYVCSEPLGQRGEGFTEAWFSANPAASVAAVLGCPIYTAHYRLYQADATGDDHAAALSIIEAHVAGRGRRERFHRDPGDCGGAEGAGGRPT